VHVCLGVYFHLTYTHVCVLHLTYTNIHDCLCSEMFGAYYIHICVCTGMPCSWSEFYCKLNSCICLRAMACDHGLIELCVLEVVKCIRVCVCVFLSSCAHFVVCVHTYYILQTPHIHKRACLPLFIILGVSYICVSGVCVYIYIHIYIYIYIYSSWDAQLAEQVPLPRSARTRLRRPMPLLVRRPRQVR
jgi:hypothetical protein